MDTPVRRIGLPSSSRKQAEDLSRMILEDLKRDSGRVLNHTEKFNIGIIGLELYSNAVMIEEVLKLISNITKIRSKQLNFFIYPISTNIGKALSIVMNKFEVTYKAINKPAPRYLREEYIGFISDIVFILVPQYDNSTVYEFLTRACLAGLYIRGSCTDRGFVMKYIPLTIYDKFSDTIIKAENDHYIKYSSADEQFKAHGIELGKNSSSSKSTVASSNDREGFSGITFNDDSEEDIFNRESPVDTEILSDNSEDSFFNNISDFITIPNHIIKGNTSSSQIIESPDQELLNQVTEDFNF